MTTNQLTQAWWLVFDVIAKALTCVLATVAGYIGSMAAAVLPVSLFSKNWELLGPAYAIGGWCWVVACATLGSWYLKRYRHLGFPFWAALGFGLGALPVAMMGSLFLVGALVGQPE